MKPNNDRESHAPWSGEEWKFCLECFAKSETSELAFAKFRKHFNRTEKSVSKKFENEGLRFGDILDSADEFDWKDYLDAEKRKSIEHAKRLSERNLVLKAKKFMGVTEYLKEELVKHIKRIEPPKLSKKKHKNKSETSCEIVAVISDSHVGELVHAKDVGGMGEYSLKIFKKRLEKWKISVIEYIKHMQLNYKVEKLHLSFLGDNVDGDDIYNGHGWHVQTDAMKQVLLASKVFTEAVADIAKEFPHIKIEIEQLGGNHGRVGMKDSKPYKVNWDLLFGHLMATYLDGFKNISHVIPSTWFSIRKICGWDFLFVHGDDVKGENGISSAHFDYSTMLHRIIHYMVIGHQHGEKTYSMSYMKQMVNGDWVGGNSYSKRITKISRPMQIVFSVDKDRGIFNHESVYLDNFSEFMERTEKHIFGAKK